MFGWNLFRRPGISIRQLTHGLVKKKRLVLSCAVHRLTRAVQMYWLAHLASARDVRRLLYDMRWDRTHSMWAVSCTFLRFVVHVNVLSIDPAETSPPHSHKHWRHGTAKRHCT